MTTKSSMYRFTNERFNLCETKKNCRMEKTQKFIKFQSLFIILCNFITYVISDDILPGSTLHASNPNQKWSSPQKTFSLLFLPITPTTFSLCICYGGTIPIWKPARKTDGNSTFHFLNDGNLRLVNGFGVVLWESNTANLGATYATLEETGNFVLKVGSLSLWQSFEHLTDTLVPSQNLTVNSVLTSGFYSFKFIRDGNLTLRWNNSILYWSFGGNSSLIPRNLSEPSLSFNGIGVLSLNDLSLVNPISMVYSDNFGEGDDFRFVRLDDDGNLRMYSVNQGNHSLTVRWVAVGDQCEVFGYCGKLGICSYNESDEPTCSCPSENFVPVELNGSVKGCKRKVEIKDCPGREAVLQMNHTKFLTYFPETASDEYILGISACRTNCLYGRMCVASSTLADATGLCYIKTSDILSGYQSPMIPGSSFVKVCGPVEPNPLPRLGTSSSGLQLQSLIVALVILVALLSLVILACVFWCSCCRKNPNFGGLSAKYTLLEYASATPVQFSYRDLHRATKGFKEQLGSGGFGVVYKGSLSDKLIVAVKQLEGIGQGERQFRMEVATISSTHHLNLVRLIGFCSQGRHRLLVYEFMKSGSLDKFLFPGNNEAINLNWEQRFNLALGTARGITYLHEECRECIVHCDIKPENILLDENFNAKVSDFGLAKLISPNDQRHRSLTTLRGTRGYLGPEWLGDMPITSKVDVYSFGMVLLEIVTGRRNFDFCGETSGKLVTSWAYEELEKGNIANIVDTRLGDQFNLEEVTRTLLVSFWCIQEQPSQRPMMGKTIQMLEGLVDIERPPPLKANNGPNGTNAATYIATTCSTSSPSPSSNQKRRMFGMDLELEVVSPSSTLLSRGPD